MKYLFQNSIISKIIPIFLNCSIWWFERKIETVMMFPWSDIKVILRWPQVIWFLFYNIRKKQADGSPDGRNYHLQLTLELKDYKCVVVFWDPHSDRTGLQWAYSSTQADFFGNKESLRLSLTHINRVNKY